MCVCIYIDIDMYTRIMYVYIYIYPGRQYGSKCVYIPPILGGYDIIIYVNM